MAALANPLRYDLITDLQRTLKWLPTDDSEGTRARNLDLIHRLGQPRHILAVLDRVLAQRVLLGEIAGRSYRHVNHFDKIVLVDSATEGGYRLTLHFWSPPYSEAELNDELIHDHRFSFWSTILTGTLASVSFLRAGRGDVYRQYQYTPQKRHVSTMANFYTLVGEAALAQQRISRKPAGASYFLNYECTHRVVIPRREMTCTLVLRGPRQRDFSNVFNTSYPNGDTRTDNVMFTEAELASRLIALSRNIAGKRLATERILP
jgi:hypothetical protein